MKNTEVVIVGGGIVGLATAYRLGQRFPRCPVTVVEKEAAVGMHQTGHNSGVLHSGMYYKPGSLRAANCRSGKRAMEEFCAAQEIPYEICGKVIVAVEERELPLLDRIFERGQANGVTCQQIDGHRLRELEPHAAGIRAIHVPEAGIVNYRRVAERLARLVQDRGGVVQTVARVERIERRGGELVVGTSAGEIVARYLVNCAGLYSDHVARLAGDTPQVQIVPFRGEYYELRPEAQRLVRNLIYPVPNPEFPFLGVHFTRMIDGGVECGPNAVLAFAREGYRKRDVNWSELWESLRYAGFRRLCAKYWWMGAGEMYRSVSKTAFVRALQRLVPEIRSTQLVPGRAGVRAQALAPDGTIVDDFLIQQGDRVVNVANAPSPAATSALNIGQMVVDKLVAWLA